MLVIRLIAATPAAATFMVSHGSLGKLLACVVCLCNHQTGSNATCRTEQQQRPECHHGHSNSYDNLVDTCDMQATSNTVMDQNLQPG